MKKLLGLAIALILCTTQQMFAVTISDDTVSGVNRYAVYIGCNYGGKSRERLLYAGSDAQSFKVAMSEIGGVTDDNSRILIDPSKENVDTALSEISQAILENNSNSKRSEFIFYYSGHSDENALLLGDAKYDYSKLKAAISAVPSDIHVVILDSCYSGNFIRTKGGQKRKPFLIDDSSVVTGHAYLSSSSDNESSQESDEIAASYFTNAMITGLRGAADTSGDNKVTLNELYSYAFNDTLSKTESSKAGPQHPNFNITLVGSGDLVLSDLTTAEAMLSLSKDAKGRFIIRDANDKLISEINKIQGQPIFMALPSGQYSAMIIDEYSTKQGTFILEKDQVYVLDQNSLSSIKRKSNRLRGETKNNSEESEDDDEDFLSMDDLEETKQNKKAISTPLIEDEEDLDLEDLDEDEEASEDKPASERYTFDYNTDNIINLMFVPGVYFVYNGSDDSIFNLGIVGSYGHNISALQFSHVFNIATGNIFGGQVAGVFNIASEQVNGAQSAGVFNLGKDNAGAQVAGVFNLTKFMNGIQLAGVMNIGKEINGTQLAGVGNVGKVIDGAQIAGAINIANEVNGVQVSGFMNIAKKVDGMQIGVMNIVDECNGMTLGLINYCGNGLHDFSISIDTNDCISVFYQGGSKQLFTTYGVSRSREKIFENGGFGSFIMGLGTEIPFPVTSLDIEVLWKYVYADNYLTIDDEDLSKEELMELGKTLLDNLASSFIPSIKLSWNIFETTYARLFFGTEFDIFVPGWNDYAFSTYKTSWTIDSDEFKISPSLTFGCKIRL